MQRHIRRVAKYGWLPAVALVAILVNDMGTAISNADKNIHDVLVNFGYETAPSQMASYVWGHPWSFLLLWVLIFTFGGLISWFGEKVIERRRSRKPQKPPASPIVVNDIIFVDFDYVCGEDGNLISDVYSFAMCMDVASDLPNGETLRHVHARLYHFVGGYSVLPIRGSTDETTDIRHGEFARFEIGRMMLKPEGSSIPGTPRLVQDNRMVADIHLEQIRSDQRDHRMFAVSSMAGGQNNLVQLKNNPCGLHRFLVVLSADGVVSKRLIFQLDLYAKKASNWLTFVAGESDA